MKITEILAPGKRKPLPAAADINDIWDRILSKRCTEIIKVYQESEGEFLYRGMKTDLPWFRAASHQDRQSKDSNTRISGVFDQLLAASGMSALRKNSIFATGDRHAAAEFGQVYIVFPVDGFRYTYTNEKDLVLNNWNQIIDPTLMNRLYRAYVEAMQSKHGEDWKMQYSNHWIDFRDPDPVAGLARLKKISDEPWVQALKIEDLFNVDAFRRRYNPSNHLLYHAIDHQLEVMISGQYYAFRRDLYERGLSELVMGELT